MPIIHIYLHNFFQGQQSLYDMTNKEKNTFSSKILFCVYDVRTTQFRKGGKIIFFITNIFYNYKFSNLNIHSLYLYGHIKQSDWQSPLKQSKKDISILVFSFILWQPITAIGTIVHYIKKVGKERNFNWTQKVSLPVFYLLLKILDILLLKLNCQQY